MIGYKNGDSLRNRIDKRRLPPVSESLGFQKSFGMATKRSQPAGRKPRADAVRNRARILEAAKDAFTRSGAKGANVNLDDIAKDAGVGPGTLYRHFPTREALLEAVYRSEVAKLAAAEGKFAESMPPVEALRAWMLLFVDYIAAKHIIAPALNNAGRRALKVVRSHRRSGQGGDQRIGGACNQERRHSCRPRPARSAAGAGGRLQRRVRAGLEAEREEAGGDPDRGLAAGQIIEAALFRPQYLHGVYGGGAPGGQVAGQQGRC